MNGGKRAFVSTICLRAVDTTISVQNHVFFAFFDVFAFFWG